MSRDPKEKFLEQTVEGSHLLGPIFQNWHRIELPDSWLVAGAIAQTVWNQRHGFSPDFGISDIDLVYYDAKDLSEEAEARHSQRINRAFRAIPIQFDVKNEARVHLWYEARFGHSIDPYESMVDAIATFPTTSTAVGVRPGRYGICAPFGLDDLLSLVVRPNKTQVTRPVYEAKIERWRPLWPKLRILEWDAC